MTPPTPRWRAPTLAAICHFKANSEAPYSFSVSVFTGLTKWLKDTGKLIACKSFRSPGLKKEQNWFVTRTSWRNVSGARRCHGCSLPPCPVWLCYCWSIPSYFVSEKLPRLLEISEWEWWFFWRGKWYLFVVFGKECACTRSRNWVDFTNHGPPFFMSESLNAFPKSIVKNFIAFSDCPPWRIRGAWVPNRYQWIGFVAYFHFDNINESIQCRLQNWSTEGWYPRSPFRVWSNPERPWRRLENRRIAQSFACIPLASVSTTFYTLFLVIKDRSFLHEIQ